MVGGIVEQLPRRAEKLSFTIGCIVEMEESGGWAVGRASVQIGIRFEERVIVLERKGKWKTFVESPQQIERSLRGRIDGAAAWRASEQKSIAPQQRLAALVGMEGETSGTVPRQSSRAGIRR